MTTTKKIIGLGLSSLTLLNIATAGDISLPTAPASNSGFANAIPSISNPTLAELAVPQTRIHALAIQHKLPSSISIGGGQVALGGDVNVFALQIEYALNERLSIIASKDGFIDFNPDNTLTDQTGFANVAAGLKYAFIYDTANQFAASIAGSIELPTGNRDVFQGYGDGAVNLTVSTLKLKDKWQFSTATGLHLPFDTDAESVTGFASAHVSYRLTERITPIFEVNWFRVLNEGNGTETPISATDFEGGDFFNLGSSNAGANRDIVTAALGLRYKICDKTQVGLAYEIPLTNEEDNLMDSRITLDLVYKF